MEGANLPSIELGNDEIFTSDFCKEYPEVLESMMSPSDLKPFLPNSVRDESCMTRSLLEQHRAQNFRNAYNVTKGSRGRCLIINNRFQDCKVESLSNRFGTDKDRDNLKRLFENDLNYTVIVENECTADDIRSKCSMFILDQEFRRYDSCVLCILSHGYKEGIYGTDGKKVKESEILDFFSHAEELKGKPKLMIIQACRIAMKKPLMGFSCLGGNTIDPKCAEPAKGSGDVGELIKTLKELNLKDSLTFLDATVPNTSDILIAYSTVPGMFSWRNEKNGSWFIQAIVGVFEGNYANEHVSDMMVMVTNAIEEAFGGWQKPCSISRLRKKFYFFP